MEIVSSQEIGAKLREFRKRRGLTQEQLAECIGVAYQQVQLYENGASKMSTDRLQMVALALSVPVSSFFSDSEDERTLSDEEQQLLNGYRALDSREAREIVLRSVKK